jgi:hypothetical protein
MAASEQVKREARKELQKVIDETETMMGRELYASEKNKIARDVYKKYNLNYIG